MPRTAGCELKLGVPKIELRTMLSVHANLITVWSSDHFDNHLEERRTPTGISPSFSAR